MGYIKIRPSNPEYGVMESKFNLNFLHVSRTVKPSDDDIYRKKLLRLTTLTTYFEVIEIIDVCLYVNNYRENFHNVN